MQVIIPASELQAGDFIVERDGYTSPVKRVEILPAWTADGVTEVKVTKTVLDVIHRQHTKVSILRADREVTVLR